MRDGQRGWSYVSFLLVVVALTGERKESRHLQELYICTHKSTYMSWHRSFIIKVLIDYVSSNVMHPVQVGRHHVVLYTRKTRRGWIILRSLKDQCTRKVLYYLYKHYYSQYATEKKKTKRNIFT